MTIPIVSHGPATTGWPASGGVLADGRLRVVSRNLPSPHIAEVDLTRLTLVGTRRLAGGDGAWAVAEGPDGNPVVGLFGASGGDNLLRIEPDGVRLLARLDANYVWDVDVFADGTVLAVTSQPSRVLLVQPGRQPQPVAVLPQGGTPRTCLALGADGVLVGGAVAGRAILRLGSRRGSVSTDLLPAQLAGDEVVYASTPTPDGLVAIGTTGARRGPPAVALVDPARPASALVIRVPGESTVDALTAVGEDVVLTVRPSGALLRLDRRTRKLEQVAVPVPGSETRTVHVIDGLAVGVSADGSVWKVRMDNGATVRRSPASLGLDPQPLRSQSISAGSRHVLVGGTFHVTRHQADGSGKTIARFVPGEPKAIIQVDRFAYMAVYPAGELWQWDSRRQQPTRLAALDAGQFRPHGMAHVPDGDLLAVTTTDDETRSVLNLVERTSGSLRVVEGVIPGEVLSGVTAEGSTVYVGGSGVRPSVAAVDARTGTVSWVLRDVLRDGSFLLGLLRWEDLLVVTSVRGWMTTIDLASRRVAPPVRISESAGQLRAHPDGPLLATKDALLRLDPRERTASVVVGDLDGQYWGWAPMDVDPEGQAWFLRRRDLMRAELQPIRP